MEIDWDDYPNFAEPEFACHCGCGAADMDPDFMDKLQAARTMAGFGFRVNSGFRCIQYDNQKGGKGVHPTGHAADIGVYGLHAYELVGFAHIVGITRLGLKQHGAHEKRFIHLDTLVKRHYPSPWVWTYK
jgi:hypothetical protein